MKIEIKSTKEFIEVVDIQFPKFRKSLIFYYKIFSEDKCIMLEIGATPSISLFGQGNNANYMSSGTSVETNNGMVVTAIVSETQITNVQNKINKINKNAEL